ncbi:MAG TPA: low molecular weight protein-tyrosine-phosphatase [Bacteroidia bacterium]|nr:low molecular weight protein-tyrosine-phosphatase [Bacteroidia bacterium]
MISNPVKILMVCLGNICRSPLAEGILRHKLLEAGIKNVLVDSAGTSGWHAGQNPDQRSMENARSHGIDISKLVARPFTKKDFEEFDYIFVMDSSNYREVISLAKTDRHRHKVEFLLNKKWPGKNRAVPDPYFGGEAGFEQVFQLVSQACEAIVQDLKSK